LTTLNVTCFFFEQLKKTTTTKKTTLETNIPKHGDVIFEKITMKSFKCYNSTHFNILRKFKYETEITISYTITPVEISIAKTINLH
jgi:hypothetical protein